ncbi:37S ribosomal protein S24, mitochondrial [Quaeritorhiza haematococci]|nr:37S ribosomal protein S24, mitochondrial [Quaeritorhiza haematococci]
MLKSLMCKSRLLSFVTTVSSSSPPLLTTATATNTPAILSSCRSSPSRRPRSKLSCPQIPRPGFRSYASAANQQTKSDSPSPSSQSKPETPESESEEALTSESAESGATSIEGSSAARRSRSPGFSSSGDFNALTGDLAVDGLNRYELDFLETASWVKGLLLDMKHDGTTLAALKKPFTPPNSKFPYCLQYHRVFKYDFTQPIPSPTGNNHTTAISLHVRLADLPGLTEVQRRKLKILAGDLYDPVVDVLSLHSEIRRDLVPVVNSEGGETAAADDAPRTEIVGSGIAEKETIRVLTQVLDNLVKEAKDAKDTFEDIPLEHEKIVSKLEKRTKSLEFPKEWLQPRKESEPVNTSETDPPSPATTMQESAATGAAPVTPPSA